MPAHPSLLIQRAPLPPEAPIVITRRPDQTVIYLTKDHHIAEQCLTAARDYLTRSEAKALARYLAG